MQLPESTSQSRMLPSYEADASRLPGSASSAHTPSACAASVQSAAGRDLTGKVPTVEPGAPSAVFVGGHGKDGFSKLLRETGEGENREKTKGNPGGFSLTPLFFAISACNYKIKI